MKYHILATMWVAERRPGDAVERERRAGRGAIGG